MNVFAKNKITSFNRVNKKLKNEFLNSYVTMRNRNV